MPTTTGKATDFITFSRASLATVTDSDGKIKWAPHNLLEWSESLDRSAWVKTSATVTANNIAAPNGTTTAETIAASGANATVLETYTAEPVSHVFGVWLRRKTGTGNIQIAADSATWTTVTITSDWALYTVTQTATAGSRTAGIRIVTSGDEIYAWGAHLYRSDLGGMQANTSAYPMYNPTTPKNLLGFTEAFDNAAWSKSNFAAFGSGSVANAAVAPNGLQTADLLIPDTTSAAHTIFQNSTAGGLNVQSIYVKPAGYTKIAMRESQTGAYYASFNLVGAGSVLDSASATAAITALSDGWYRISMIGTISGTTRWSVYFLSPSYTSGSVIVSWTPDGTSGIYLWGAQLSDSASLDPYVANAFAAPTSSAYNGPRLDFDGSTQAAKGLLVEEQRTNLLLQSAAFDNVIWAKTNGTITTGIADPFGGTTAATLTATGAAILQQAPTVASGVALAGSIWIRRRTGTGQISLRVGDATAIPITITSAWERISASATPTSTSGRFAVILSVTGDEVDIWGAQLEAGSFATSYIPTGASTVTRSADVASVATSAFPYSSTEGTVVFAGDYIGQSSTSAYSFTLNDGTAVNFTGLRRAISNGSQVVVNVAANVQDALIVGPIITNNTTYKTAVAYKVNDYAAVTDGTLSGTDTVATVPTTTTLGLGQLTNNSFLNGHIRQITYIPRRLSNAELQARTV